ncbi:hypothetical protein RRSWK_04235 [Rhodopirellula sp. SWK7]|nr:hypothetical protein RRSWK_04235 [Rhodopirellula sp. SWK7]
MTEESAPFGVHASMRLIAELTNALACHRLPLCHHRRVLTSSPAV